MLESERQAVYRERKKERDMNEISVIFTIYVLWLVKKSKSDLLIYKMHNCDDMW